MASVSTTEKMPIDNAQVNSSENPNLSLDEDFLTSGRTGRRNAVPDIYCPQSRVSTAELPANFARLTCDGKCLNMSYKLHCNLMVIVLQKLPCHRQTAIQTQILHDCSCEETLNTH